MHKGLFKRLLPCFVFVFFSETLFAATDSQKRSDFIAAAKSYLGTPYVYGGCSSSGMDCSALIYLSAKKAGIENVPRSSAAQYSACKKIDRADLESGDLVFFAVNSKVSHVGIFLGNNKFIHCASEGPKTGVIISLLSESYWKNHYYASGRIIGATKSGVQTAAAKTYNDDGLFSMEFIAAAGWNFFTETQTDFYVKNGYVQCGIKTESLKCNPGIMLRAMYIKDGCYALPLCMTLDFNKYVSVFAGAVLPVVKDAESEFVPYGQSEPVKYSIFPGVFGVEFRTPSFNLANGKSEISLLQNITYMHVTSEISDLSFLQTLSAGLSFSTGICFYLDL